MALVAALLAVLAAGLPAAAQELTLAVATSMREAAEEVGTRFMQEHAGVRLRYSVGASGELQRQIEAGAPVDVFVSAATRQMDELERAGRILPETRRVVASNVLIAVKPPDSPQDIPGPSDLLDRRIRSIAIGDPRTVAAGQYAEESLRALGLWGRVAKKLVLVDNVRQALEQVTRGEVDVAAVYATDAVLRLGRVRLAFAFPEDTYRPILYPAAVVASSHQPELARALVEHFASREGQAVLGRLGFLPPPPERR